MGKGDIKTRRGKFFAGSFGKRRPKKRRKSMRHSSPAPSASQSTPVSEKEKIPASGSPVTPRQPKTGEEMKMPEPGDKNVKKSEGKDVKVKKTAETQKKPAAKKTVEKESREKQEETE